MFVGGQRVTGMISLDAQARFPSEEAQPEFGGEALEPIQKLQTCAFPQIPWAASP